jgi:hypothetical protein
MPNEPVSERCLRLMFAKLEAAITAAARREREADGREADGAPLCR